MVMNFSVQKDLEMQLLAEKANSGAINDDDTSKDSDATSEEDIWKNKNKINQKSINKF